MTFPARKQKIARIAWVCSVYAQWFHKECPNTYAKHLSHH